MRSDYLDTVLFAAAAVLGIAFGWIMLKMRQIERDMDQRDEDCLKDEDMRLEDDEPTTNLKGVQNDNER